MTDQGSNTANQAYFAPRFIGVAKEAFSSTQTRSTVLVDRIYIGPMTVVSGTYIQGDLLTPKENTGGTYLENMILEKTTTVPNAIGYIYEDTGGEVTTATVCLISRVLPVYMPTISTTNNAGMSMDEGANFAFGTSTGSKMGESELQKLGFWNATPVVQPTSADQAATSMTATEATLSSAAPDDMTAIATYGTSSTPWGFDNQAHLNTLFTDLEALNAAGLAANTSIYALNTQVDALNTDVHALNTLLNQIRTDLVTVGLIKGS